MALTDKLTAIGDAIRSKTETTELIPLTAMPAKVNDVYEAGRKAEYDRFWDAFQQNGERNNYIYAFSNWDDGAYKPKYPIIGTLANAFRTANLTDTKVAIISSPESAANAFYESAALVTIRSLDVTEATNIKYIFQGCAALENVTFVGEIKQSLEIKQSSKLTDESVQSIIDHLKDLTGQTAQTLTLHSAVAAKLTDSQKAVIAAKNWTLVY